VNNTTIVFEFVKVNSRQRKAIEKRIKKAIENTIIDIENEIMKSFLVDKKLFKESNETCSEMKIKMMGLPRRGK